MVLSPMKITIYTIPDCQFSKAEKEYLTSKNLPFEEKNLESNRDFLTEMLTVSNNFAGTPVTKIEKDDGEIVVLKGFTQEEFEKEMTQSSEPAEIKAEQAPTMSTPVSPMPVSDPVTSAPVAPAPSMSSEPAVPHLEMPDISMPEAPAVVPPQASNTVPDDLKSNFPAPTSFDPNAFKTEPTPTPVQMTPEPEQPTPTSDTGLNSILDNLQAKVNSTPDQSQPVAPVSPVSTPPTQV